MNKELFDVFLRVARDYKLPVRVAKEWGPRIEVLQSSLTPNDVFIARN